MLNLQYILQLQTNFLYASSVLQNLHYFIYQNCKCDDKLKAYTENMDAYPVKIINDTLLTDIQLSIINSANLTKTYAEVLINSTDFMDISSKLSYMSSKIMTIDDDFKFENPSVTTCVDSMNAQVLMESKIQQIKKINFAAKVNSTMMDYYQSLLKNSTKNSSSSVKDVTNLDRAITGLKTVFMNYTTELDSQYFALNMRYQSFMSTLSYWQQNLCTCDVVGLASNKTTTESSGSMVTGTRAASGKDINYFQKFIEEN